MSQKKPLDPPDANNPNVKEPVPGYQVLALRGAIVGLGVLGAYIYIRRSKLFASLKHVGEIPESFIRKELQLQGVVREVRPNGLLKVEHLPVIGLPRFLVPKKKATDLLSVRLAGLDVSKAGIAYLTKDLKLNGRKVFFTAIKPTDKEVDSLDADVTVKKQFLGSVNLNVDLVRKGYARVFTLDYPPHYEALQKNSAYSRLITQLLTCEKVAEKRAIGIWERNSWVESLRSLPHAAGQMVRSSAITKFVVLLATVLSDLITIVVHALRHAYYFGVATVDLASVGYRAFGQRVDRLTKFYARQKSRIIKDKPTPKP